MKCVIDRFEIVLSATFFICNLIAFTAGRFNFEELKWGVLFVFFSLRAAIIGLLTLH
jgi:hypothetical protein